ncbi:MAG: inositol-3-phosphate synthase [Planctomycetes bacterium]|nr:inositol-3-phosphate synthase [Planctomycetota bacterium]MCB9904681.1 inositol-3-phosphate synthase [Planctomycetota bacterium]
MSTQPKDVVADLPRVGVWLVGARGAISTCLAYGLAGICEGVLEPLGLCTERDPVARLPLVPLEGLVLGGHDVCTRSLTSSAAELVQTGVLRSELVEHAASRASDFEGRIRPGILDGPDVGGLDLDPRAAELGSRSPREQIAHVQADLAAFQEECALERIVVVNVSSTEAVSAAQPEWRSLEELEAALDAGKSQPASMLYAYAALDAGCAHVNFTPNRGAGAPALRQLAAARKLPHCGNDGKTGETLVKTVLGPMFPARALRVLSWQGYNMLGNRDGEVLRVESHKESKLQNKDEALRSILGDPGTHTHVGIDYVPSLQDWKTAWDYVHFEGFLGARMSLQFTWSGSDSALAAPLVLDLVRLSEYAARSGETGDMPHTACFFKAPLGGGTHDFHAQYRRLLEYVESHVG